MKRHIAMLVLALASLSAAQHSDAPVNNAILHAGSDTSVDGTPATNNMAVLNGNVVETKGTHFGELVNKGSVVRIVPGSKVTYQSSGLELNEGGVGVQTTAQFEVKKDCLTISPTQATASRYSVTPDGDKLIVAAEAGEVDIAGVHNRLRLPEGKTAAVGSWCENGEWMRLTSPHKLTRYLWLGAAAAAPAALIGHGSSPKMSSDQP